MPRSIDLRVEHKYREDLCCGLPAGLHRRRNNRTDTRSDRKRVWVKETICIDGEGESLPDGTHQYILLASSNNDGNQISTITAISLSTKQCFEFLLSLPSSARKVSFSFNYDVNMMLRDVPEHKLRLLHEKGFCWWHGYRISWIPHKQFSISLRRPESLGGVKKCVVWDMFGYFQKSFSRTIHEWNVGTDEERKLVADMKAKRSGFIGEDKDKIQEYCLLECKLGAQVFDKLLNSCTNVGLNLQRYDGAGSVAAAMLRLHSVNDYKNNDGLPEEIALKGYFGGRFDHTAYGKIGSGYEYDINSAYPNIARDLPCLYHGSWRYTKQYNVNAIGIWYCEWELEDSTQWAPFPFRIKSNVGYWRSGRGWYWDSEIRAAMHLYPFGIRVYQGWTFTRDCGHKPFRFINDYFDERRKLKENGDLAQIVLKLGLNSIYGKTAQSKGKHIPPYQSFIWAGMITAGTRAMLLESIKLAGDNAILTATDAIVSTVQLPLPVGEALGEWEYKVCKNLFIVQNGVYESIGNKQATRGFAPADISFGAIRKQAAKESRFDIVVRETRFIGLGEALARVPALRGWRTWEEGTSRVRFGHYPERRVEGNKLYLLENPCTEDSAPFEPKFSTNVGTKPVAPVAPVLA